MPGPATATAASISASSVVRTLQVESALTGKTIPKISNWDPLLAGNWRQDSPGEPAGVLWPPLWPTPPGASMARDGLAGRAGGGGAWAGGRPSGGGAGRGGGGWGACPPRAWGGRTP